MVIRIVLSILLWISAEAAGGAEVHHFKPSKGHQTYAVREPVLRVNPGDSIETNTFDLPSSRMKRIEVKLKPMLGRLATAPPGDQAIPGGVPSNFGGNMDTSEACEGAAVYLPVFHEGAYFYYGDVHALQGDGEIIGSGIETSADVTLN